MGVISTLRIIASFFDKFQRANWPVASYSSNLLEKYRGLKMNSDKVTKLDAN